MATVGKTIPRLDIERLGGLQGLRQSVTTKLALLISIFLAIPILLYFQFQIEDRAKNRILQTSLVGQGQSIAIAMTPFLENPGLRDPLVLTEKLGEMRQEGVRIRLLFRPTNQTGNGQVFYIDSVPSPERSDLVQEEIDEMVDRGILEWMSSTCLVEDPSTRRFQNRAGQIELITSVTPIPLEAGCWAIMTSHSDETLISSSLGRETWRTPAVQIAGVIYALIAGLVAWLVFDIWTNLQRFRKGAERIRSLEFEGVSFAELNKIPELSGAAEEFDRLVQALARSRQMIRQAADENAHALKTPLATIAQALEPLKRTLPREDQRGARSLDLIEQSVNRLDSLVSSAKDLESAAADSFSGDASEVDFSQLLASWISRYRDTLATRGIGLVDRITPGLRVKASEDALETIFENLIENAASFSPKGSEIEISLTHKKRMIVFAVADQGPGVDPQVQQQIFDRYFSHRPEDGIGSVRPKPGDNHFGLGLWIVKRNVESFGGTVQAGNRPKGGFLIVVCLPQARS